MNGLFIILVFLAPLSLVGQCMDPDEHNTSITDTWISCDQRASPLGGTELSHWIMYEFDEVQSIEEIQIWNINHPIHGYSGAKNIKMETSADGARWEIRDTFELSMSLGGEAYTGERFDEIAAFEAKFILLTILENHGGQCTGLSEVKFSLGETTTTATAEEYLVNQVLTSPNPADEYFKIEANSLEAAVSSFRLVDMMGRVHMYEEIENRGTISDLSISTVQLPDGQYALHLDTDQGVIAKSIVVVHPN